MVQIAEWLRGIGLECYAHSFAANDIDFRSLDLLTERDLEALGVSMGHRRLLAHALEMRKAAITNGAADPHRSPLVASADTGERRQVTAIFCDVVNSTGLATMIDPETWREILRRYEKMCTRDILEFDGYVFQRMGDGIVAYFGYPTAHEDAPVRAIRAGLRIFEHLADLVLPDKSTLQVRIGISTGLVVVDDIRSKERSAVGHTMNLAARLQSTAEPGQIVVSDTTFRLAGGNFEYVGLGELNLKGIAHPERAWRVVGLGRAEGRFDAATGASLSPLIGREEELAFMLDRWVRVGCGDGQAVVLSGEPGVGKSRVLHALRERMGIDHAHVIYCQCAPFFSNSAFYPIIECLDRSLRDERGITASRKAERLEAMLRDDYGLSPRDVTLIVAMFSLAAPQGGSLDEMTPQRQREETIRALVDLIAAASRHGPILMIFEDLHWADPTTLQTLKSLIERLEGFRVLLIVTHRPEFVAPWAPGAHVATLAIAKLTRSDSARLAASLGGETLPDDLLEQVIAKTDGVPLYVEELIRAILESRTLIEAGKPGDASTASQAFTIPATLRDSLMERLDRLGDDKEVAQVGSVLGREFSLAMLRAVAPWPEAELDDALQRLLLSGLVLRRGGDAETDYAFKHALVQEAAYDSLLRTVRQQLHRRIAETLEERFVDTTRMRPELLAHHYGRAGLHRQAFPFWYQAGKHAVARSANLEAINHLEAGLQSLKSMPPGSAYDAHELQFQTLLGNALMAVKGYGSPNVGSTFDRALELCGRLGDTAQLFPVLRGLWMFYLVRSELATARKLGDQLLQLAERVQDSAAWLEAHRAMGMTCFFSGEFAKARHHFECALTVHDPEKHRDHAYLYGTDPVVACQSYIAATLWILGFPDQALARARDGVRVADGLAHGFSRSFALFFAAMLHQYRRESGDAREQADADILFSRDGGFVLWFAMALIVRGWADVEDGHPAEGLADMRRGLETYRATGARLAHTYISSILAESWQRCGYPDDAAALLVDADETRAASGERVFEAELFRVRAQQSLAALPHDAAETVDDGARGVPLRMAEANFLRALRIARAQGARSFELRAAMGLCRLWRARGRHDDARRVLADVYATFTEGHDTPDLREARRLLDA